MTNKTNHIKNRNDRGQRNSNDNSRKQKTEGHALENAAAKQDKRENSGEMPGQKGYYSRNGGYSGYRGL